MSISALPPRRRRLSLTGALAILSLICAALLVAVAVTWPFESDDVAVQPPPPPSSTPHRQPDLLPAVGKQGIPVKQMVAAFHDRGFTLVPYDTAATRFDPIRKRIVAAYRFNNDAGRFVMVIARVPLGRFAAGVSQLPTPLDRKQASGKLYIEYDSSLAPRVLDRIRAALRTGAPATR
jgi:hypothetical protein